MFNWWINLGIVGKILVVFVVTFLVALVANAITADPASAAWVLS